MQSRLVFANQTIESDALLKGVSLEQSINSEVDFQIGVCGCAQVTFSTMITNRPTVGDSFTLYMKQYQDSDYRQIGVFNVVQSDKIGQRIDVVAYDNMWKLEKNVDAWLDNQVFPMSLYTFTSNLANECGVTISLANNVANSQFEVKDNFTSTGLTGRSMLQYICQVCGGFAICNTNGSIAVKLYSANSTTLNASKYKKITIAEYDTDYIDSLQAKVMDDDIGVIVGNGGEYGTNLYDSSQAVEGYYINASGQITQQAGNLYSQLMPVTVGSYYALTGTSGYSSNKRIHLYDSNGNWVSQLNAQNVANRGVINIQGIIPNGVSYARISIRTLDTDIQFRQVTGGFHNTYIIENNPLLYTETDSEIRPVVQNIFTKLSGVTYRPMKIELLGDWNIQCGHILTVQGYTTYIMSKSITPNGVTLTCTGNKSREKGVDGLNEQLNALRGKYNRLSRTVEQTVSELGDAEGNISTLTQTVEGLDSRVTTAEGDATEAKQTANSFSTRITNAEGDISSIEQTMNGVVLTTSQGSTYINGANIKSGSIVLTGLVDWDDLNSETQEQIEGLVSDYGDSDVRSLLSSTYNITQTQADGTQISSPKVVGGKIYGAEIYAGNGNDGYMKMDQTGMDLYTTAGRKAVIGIGYTSANYEYPYILFGRGVDTSGTDCGMIKKYQNGIWIGDNDGQAASAVGSGDGMFINFTDHNTYIYRNGSSSLVGQAVFI